MSVTLTGISRSAKGSTITLTATLVFSGTYAAGGDVLDLTLFPQVKGTLNPLSVEVLLSASSYQSKYVPGATANLGKIINYVGTTGVEVAAGAMPAALSGDTGAKIIITMSKGGFR